MSSTHKKTDYVKHLVRRKKCLSCRKVFKAKASEKNVSCPHCGHWSQDYYGPDKEPKKARVQGIFKGSRTYK